jgi:hypothetical protein
MKLTVSEAMKAIQRFNDWQIRQQPTNSTYRTGRFIAYAGFANSLLAGYAVLNVAPF